MPFPFFFKSSRFCLNLSINFLNEKMALVFKIDSNPDGVDALCKDADEMIEHMASIASSFNEAGALDILYERRQKDCRRVLRAVLELVRAMLWMPVPEHWNTLVGGVMQACDDASKCPKTNLEAAIMFVLNVYLEAKDTVNEFSATVKAQEEGAEECLFTDNGNDGEAMLPMEKECIQAALAVLQSSCACMRLVADAMSMPTPQRGDASYENSSIKEDNVLNVEEWAQHVLQKVNSLGSAGQDVGMSLYTPIDGTELAEALNTIRLCVDDLLGCVKQRMVQQMEERLGILSSKFHERLQVALEHAVPINKT